MLMGLQTFSGRTRTKVPGKVVVGHRSASSLAAQFEYVLANSSFYQRKFAGPRRGPLAIADLPHLPFTTRAELQEDQLQHPPFGSYLAAKPERIARVHRTSGTSGRPLVIALSAGDAEKAVHTGGACFHAAGVRPDDLIVHCLNYCLWSGGVTDHLALERTGAGVIPFGSGRTTELIRAILELRPTGLHCTPSYLARIEQRLAAEFQMAPADLRLRIGLFGREPGLQDAAFRERIERTWGLRAMDANYGMSEVLSIFGAECELRNGLHFMAPDQLVVELKDPGSDAVLPWEPGVVGELVLTHVARECQPLIRYRASDVVRLLDTGPCDCGRTSARFQVVGRVDDMIVVRGVNLYPSAIAHVINEMPDALTGEFCLQVSQSCPVTQCRLLVEVLPGANSADTTERLDRALWRRLGVRMEVVPTSAENLPRCEGKSRRVQRLL